MALLYEVWDVPWSGTGLKRRFHWLPVIEGTGRGTISFLTTQGEGMVDVSISKLTEMGRDIEEIVSDTTSSLIRVIDCDEDGTRTIIDEWICERPGEQHDDSKTVTLSGPPLKTKAFDSAIARPFDYPANPTRLSDHIWGGRNILSDPGFENPALQNESYEIILDGANGGTFVLHINGEDTASLDWDISEGALENAIQALTSITDVFVSETSDGWNVEFHNPSDLDSDMTWTPSVTGGDGDETIEKTQEGLVQPSGTWTTSRAGDASSDPHIHGSYGEEGFRLTEDAEPVHSGTYAARVNGQSQFSGLQQVVRVEPGMVYQCSIWYWSTDATETFRLVLRDFYERLITPDSFVNVTNTTPSTWHQATLEVTIPEGVEELIFRFAQTQDHNPVSFYADDAVMAEGMLPTPWGDIVDIMMGTRSDIFFWMDWSSVGVGSDSGSTSWPRDENVTVQFGETFGQLWDLGVDLGYEWDLIPKDPTATDSYAFLDETHDLVWYVGGGMDADPSTAINPGPSVTGGESFKRTPAYTRVYVEGPEGDFVEDDDATTLSNFGALEKYEYNSHMNSNATLQARADELFSYEEANRNAVHFELIHRANLPRPGVHFKPGDTIPMQLPPGLAKTEKRVQDYSYVNTHPTQYMVTGSRVLEGEAAAYNLVWRMWRRFNKPIKPRRSGGVRIQGRTPAPDRVVAASGSISSDRADVVALGQDDQTPIMGQMGVIHGGGGGRLILTQGEFNIDPDAVVVGFDAGSGYLANPQPIIMQGMGNGTVIDINGDATDWGVWVAEHCKVRDFTFSETPET